MTGSAAARRLVVQAPEIETPALKALAKLAGATHIDALPGGTGQAFALSPVGNDAQVAAYCAHAALDGAIVEPGQRLDRVRLVAMDMDSTLITIECIDEIADTMGIKPQVAAITASAMRGEIDFRESLTRRVALLAGLDTEALRRVYDERLELSPGAERLLAGLRAVGPIVDAQAKAACFKRLRAELAADDGLAIAIGDGANDLPMLESADVSIAYHAKEVVRARATYAIDRCGLDAVLNLFV